MKINKEKFFVWITIIVIFFTFLYLVKSILLPFIVGILVAYFLDPAADRLEKIGTSRTMATAIITLMFFLVIITSAIFLAPLLYDQLLSLVKKTPEYVAYFHNELEPVVTRYFKDLGVDTKNGATGEFSGYLLQYLSKIVSGIWSSGVALLNLLSLIFITPVVSFYLLRDWDKIVGKVNKHLPKSYAKTIREQIEAIDQTLSGFIRGQTNVCIIMGIFYAIGLILTGLDFGLIIGISAGILTFIPYVGIFFSFAVALAAAIFQFEQLLPIALVAGVFGIGQIIESNFITPKLVGEKVGLHPVWIIFGMLAGGCLFGFVGILIAVPVTAVIGVLIRFSLTRYLQSELYKK